MAHIKGNTWEPGSENKQESGLTSQWYIWGVVRMLYWRCHTTRDFCCYWRWISKLSLHPPVIALALGGGVGWGQRKWVGIWLSSASVENCEGLPPTDPDKTLPKIGGKVRLWVRNFKLINATCNCSPIVLWTLMFHDCHYSCNRNFFSSHNSVTWQEDGKLGPTLTLPQQGTQ